MCFPHDTNVSNKEFSINNIINNIYNIINKHVRIVQAMTAKNEFCICTLSTIYEQASIMANEAILDKG